MQRATCFLFMLSVTQSCLSGLEAQSDSTQNNSVLTGIDVLERDQYGPLDGKRVGLITNHTGLSRSGISTAALLHNAPNVELKILFSPEHGFAGQLDQRLITDTKDEQTNLKIVSLYGATRKPPAETLAGLNALVFDIQDIGARFYTYVSTMGNAMQVASEQGLEFVVLDRPNPINGIDVSGPVLDDGLQSFVGFHTVPVRHGMTVGELAAMIKAEQGLDLNLTVIRLENWERKDYYDATGLLWVNPSPNMRNLNEAVLYPGIGLLETTNLSVGRGTDTPFEVIGAPWIHARTLANHLNGTGLPGVRFVPIQFTPDSSKFADEQCEGVNIIVTAREEFESVQTGLVVALALRELFPDDWDTKSFNRLLSDQAVYDAVKSGTPYSEIKKLFRDELSDFRQRREKHLLY